MDEIKEELRKAMQLFRDDRDRLDFIEVHLTSCYQLVPGGFQVTCSGVICSADTFREAIDKARNFIARQEGKV